MGMFLEIMFLLLGFVYAVFKFFGGFLLLVVTVRIYFFVSWSIFWLVITGWSSVILCGFFVFFFSNIFGTFFYLEGFIVFSSFIAVELFFFFSNFCFLLCSL